MTLAAVVWVKRRGHLALLQLFGTLPVWARRRVVRTVAPNYTMGSLAVVHRGEQILLIRQVYRRHWGLPGGLVEKGESPADAVRREVWEETGLSIEVTGPPAVVIDVAARRIDVVFPARPLHGDGGELAGAAGRSPEIAEVRWCRRDDCPELQAEANTAIEALERRAAGPLILPGGSSSGWLV